MNQNGRIRATNISNAIIYLLLFFSTVFMASAQDRLIREEVYFDGYSYALRYSVDGIARTAPENITWYAGRFKSQPITEGPECFVIPDAAGWITCTITGTDGKKRAETLRVVTDLPGSPDRDLSTVYLTLPKPGSALILKGNPDSMAGLRSG